MRLPWLCAMLRTGHNSGSCNGLSSNTKCEIIFHSHRPSLNGEMHQNELQQRTSISIFVKVQKFQRNATGNIGFSTSNLSNLKKICNIIYL